MGNFDIDLSSFAKGIDLDNIGLDDIAEIISKLPVDEMVGNNKTSVFSADMITYLYSGPLNVNGSPISAMLIANAFDNGRTVDKTVAANFLGTDIFEEILGKAISNDMLNGKFDISRVEKGIHNRADLDELMDLLKSSLIDCELDRATQIASTPLNSNQRKVHGQLSLRILLKQPNLLRELNVSFPIL